MYARRQITNTNAHNHKDTCTASLTEADAHACGSTRAYLSFLCYICPQFHPSSARIEVLYPGSGEVYQARPGPACGGCFSVGGGAALPSGAEAARAGGADLALVLGTSGGAGRGVHPG